MNEDFVDLLGRDIEEGDIITFPGRRGSHMWMTFALVRGLCEQATWTGKRRFLKVESYSEHWSDESKCKLVVRSVTRWDRALILSKDQIEALNVPLLVERRKKLYSYKAQQ